MAAEEGGKQVGVTSEGEDGLVSELREEGKIQEGRNLRSSKKKELKEGNMSKEASGMKKYLETGKLLGENGIVKGNELRRTPVKAVAGSDDSDKRGSGSGGRDAKADEGRERATASRQAEKSGANGNDDAGSGSGACGGEEEKVCEASVSVWMRSVCQRVRELESRLERERLCESDIERDLVVMKEKNKEYESELNKLRRGMEEILQRMEEERGKNMVLEKRIMELEEALRIKEGEDSVGGMSSRGDLMVLEAEVRKNGEKGEGGDSENNIVVTEKLRLERGYLRKIPDKLSKGEYEWEMRERNNRKKNVMIRGVRTVGRGIKDELKGLFKDYLDTDIFIREIRAIGGGLLVECEALENKIEIMKRKGMLRGVDIWIEDDFTEREKQVQGWLKSIVREEKKNGLETRLGYFKIQIDGSWYRWEEKRGRVELMNFRGEREWKRL